MLHEYALDPEFIKTLNDLWKRKYVTEGFGKFQGRVIAQFPKNWVRRIWQIISPQESGWGEIELSKFVSLLKDQGALVERQNTQWDDQKSWLENAESEHQRKPFHAIFSIANPRNHRNVFEGEALEWTNPYLRVEASYPVPRNAAAMAACIAPMLQFSKWIMFVDPYFDPEKSQFKNTLREFLRIACVFRATSFPAVEYHVKEHDRAPSEAEFARLCQLLASRIPRNISVKFYRWAERPGGQRVHDRFILTDMGGVGIGHGLDEGEGTTDIFRLSEDSFKTRLEHFRESPVFDQVGNVITVQGTA